MFFHIEANNWVVANEIWKEFKQGKYGPGKRFATSNDTQQPQREGLYTTEDEKSEWLPVLRRDFCSGAIAYSSEFVTNTHDFKYRFEEQVRFWREQDKEPDDPMFGTTKHAIGGKGLGGKKDDIVCAYLLAAHQRLAMIDDEGWQNVATDLGVLL